MWTSLAFAAGLFSMAAGEAEAVKFANIRFTYCQFGAERTDTKFLPGDILMLAYDIENLAIDKKTGKVVYSLDLELVDSKGARVFKRSNPNVEEQNTLLSYTQPGNATVVIGKDQAPGKYTLKVTVNDRIEKKSATFKREFEILKEGLGIVRVNAPVVSLVGLSYSLTFTVVGFGKEKKLPSFVVEVNILNDKGEAMLSKPKTLQVPKDLTEEVSPENLSELTIPNPFSLNRVGKFTFHVKVIDKTTKKEKELKYPVTILDIKKYESATKSAGTR